MEKLEYLHRQSVSGLEEIDLVLQDEVVSTLTYAVHLRTDSKMSIIDLLYTPEVHRGKGYASKLLRHVLDILPQPIFLFVKGGTFVITFYERYGFKPIERFGCYQLMAYSTMDVQELLRIWTTQS
jgi:GNAT superfamily N-acetyltransferase